MIKIESCGDIWQGTVQGLAQEWPAITKQHLLGQTFREWICASPLLIQLHWGYHRAPGCSTLELKWKFEADKWPVSKSKFKTSLENVDITTGCPEGNVQKAFATVKGIVTPPFHKVAAKISDQGIMSPCDQTNHFRIQVANLIAFGQMLRGRCMASRVTSPMLFQIALQSRCLMISARGD